VGPLSRGGGTRDRVAPLLPGRYSLQVTIDQETYEDVRYARELLGHAVPSRELAKLMKRAFRELVQVLEKKKFAKCVQTRPRRGSSNARYVPSEIRRTVWLRDGGQCTFVSEKGQRCGSRSCLEFDHIEAVARGGQTTASQMRLRCRAHNQYEAERTFGAEFMRNKREQARDRAVEAKARTRAEARALAQEQARASAETRTQPREDEQARTPAQCEAATDTSDDRDVRPWLRALGFNSVKARRGAELCAHMPDAPLAERVRVALKGLAPQCRRLLPDGSIVPA
jgi:5-methylcytosine-specific restriction endonuclease McrA